jgi:hypothetical protein
MLGVQDERVWRQQGGEDDERCLRGGTWAHGHRWDRLAGFTGFAHSSMASGYFSIGGIWDIRDMGHD